MVVPARSPGGQRIYSRDDLEYLRFVLKAMEDGAGVGDAHRLLGEKLHVAGARSVRMHRRGRSSSCSPNATASPLN